MRSRDAILVIVFIIIVAVLFLHDASTSSLSSPSSSGSSPANHVDSPTSQRPPFPITTQAGQLRHHHVDHVKLQQRQVAEVGTDAARRRSSPDEQFVARMQSALSKWSVACLDARNKKNPLSWQNEVSSSCPHQFRNLLESKQDDLVFRVAAQAGLIEAHGDSTLRELAKFLISRLGVAEASLDKKDANMTMRRPRYFSRTITEKTWRGRVDLVFRFDFVGEHLLEPLSSSIHADEAASSPLFLVSIGSHVAKQFALDEQKTKAGDVEQEKTKQRQVETIRNKIVLPLQQMLIQRLVLHSSSNRPPSLILFMMQSVECGAMAESSSKGFRDMAALCPAMESFLTQANAMIAADVASIVQSQSVDDMRKKLAVSSACSSPVASPFCHLSDAELEMIRSRFLFAAASRCSDAAFSSAKSSGSLRHCTRDGIHFRSRFIKIRVDLILNVLAAWMRQH